MAKFKKTATAGKSAPRASRPASKAQAERLGRTISESAQQIWLAGMGAFKRTQAEGTKLFESLVRDGLNLEQSMRKVTGARADAVRDAMETGVGQARERAADTWDRLEKVFEDRVQRALVKLGVPGRDDLNALTARVERLTEELRKAAAGKPAGAAASPKATAKRASKRTAGKRPAKAATASKASATKAPARKPAARKATGKPAESASAAADNG